MTTEALVAPGELEKRVLGIERGVRLLAVTIVLLSSAPNIALAFSIEAQAASVAALRAMLPLALPPLSEFVFKNPVYLITIAFLWPISGAIITLKARDPFRAMLASCAYLLLVSIQFTITWIAFLAPFKAFFVKT